MDVLGASLAAIVQFGLLADAVINAIVQAKTDWKKWEFWAAMVVVTGLAVAFGIDMFAALGFESSVPFIGSVATGLALSRGANYIHDTFKAVRSVSTKNGSESV